MTSTITRLKMASLGDALVRRFPPLYFRFRRELRQFEESNLAGRQALQDRLLSKMLGAATDLPGYSGLKGLPIKAFPVLTKERLRSASYDYLAAPGVLSVAAATSGSSGIPLALKRSFSSVVFEQAAIDHIVALAGGDFRRDRIAILRGEAIKAPSDRQPPYWRIERGGRIMNFSVAHLNAATAQTFVGALETFSPGVIWAYPSALEILAISMERLGRRMHVPVVLTSSEVLRDEVRAYAETMFGGCVADYYGQAERACFAYALKAGAYSFMPSYGKVELQPVDGGDQSRFRIIATNLRNRAQPLVRYDTGDIAIVPLEATGNLETVAMGCVPFFRIEGRESDYLVASDGSRLIGMNHIPRSIEGLVQMQIRQVQPDRVLVLAVTDGSPQEALKTTIAAKVASRLPSTMRVEVRFCEAIEREKNGKMPLVVREGITTPG